MNRYKIKALRKYIVFIEKAARFGEQYENEITKVFTGMSILFVVLLALLVFGISYE